MRDEWIVQHCSPTLAGIKTGSLFSCPCPDAAELRKGIRGLNRRLVEKGIRVALLRLRAGRALVYVYRPDHLRRDLGCALAEQLLQECGYCTQSSGRCILHLINRLRDREEFPHEIGLFLGYPPEDVHGFIRNAAKEAKCSGYWKVYGDVEAAKRIFECYKKCTGAYCAQYMEGCPIERLAVAG